MDTSNSRIPLKKHELWLLFVASAFPLHVWSIILLLSDASWIAARTNYGDVIGIAGYRLTFSLIESLLIFAVILLAALLLRNWNKNKRITLMGVFIIGISIWAMIGQLIRSAEFTYINEVVISLANKEYPSWLIYIGLTLIIFPSVVLPVYFAVFSERFQIGFIKILDRLSPLMGFYLFLDLLGVIIVIIRNIS